MIRYLQKLRASKGFTMAELIIVIAIMAVLMAVILPAFSSDDAEKQAAETYASDFYASLQYNMTRYQLTEFYLTPALQNYTVEYLGKDADDNLYPIDDPQGDADKNPYILYDAKCGGNVFDNKFLWIKVRYDRGIDYVTIGNSLQEIVEDTSTTSDHPFEQLLQKDLGDTMNNAGKGCYYAVVKCGYDYVAENITSSKISLDDETKRPTRGNGNITVMSAHYCEDELPAATTVADLQFTTFSELKNGIICGTCSSDDNNADNDYVGTIGSYFLNVYAMNSEFTAEGISFRAG